ncbi:MAG: prepilin-type N-terminal cleavage/methylation domain-containing protein [Phycisphaerales bacterium]|nr:prepilin-type N-terminal cleavage/methylation domain-containing protein [Phycisphaerales bacterium]
MRRAFTLVEVIIAVVILAILAAMVVPRMSKSVKAEHENAVSQMLDLLSMYAFRDATSSQQIAIWQDPETQWIALLVADRELEAAAFDGDRTKFEWVTDRRILPVALPNGMAITDLLVDGIEVSGTDWLIPTVPGGGRPSVEMHLTSDSVNTVLRLDSNATAPLRIDSGNTEVKLRESQNLDAYGSRSEKW